MVDFEVKKTDGIKMLETKDPHTLLEPRCVQFEPNDALYQKALFHKLEEPLARVLCHRLDEHIPFEHFLAPKLALLNHYQDLVDIDKASTRLAKAIINKEVIAIETDHDCDGQTSHAIILTSLLEAYQYPKEKILSFIGHRMKEGYGLSDALTTRILASEVLPTLLITADNGSSNQKNIARLKTQGIDVIVTDHHVLPKEGPPKDAFACVNPSREDCQYPDKAIAGCMVAWLVMVATWRYLQKHAKDQFNNAFDHTQLLDYVAVGTIADCVSMATSINNRIVVRYGIRQIQKQQRGCWQALAQQINLESLDSGDLGFKIGPLLNSDGRLGDAFIAVEFLMAQDQDSAKRYLDLLVQSNQERREIEQAMTVEAKRIALSQVQNGKKSICIWMATGHAGVHGISASRVKDYVGRACIIFSPKMHHQDLLTGSARSIDGIDMAKVLAQLHHNNPDLMLQFGGHSGAAGLLIAKEHFEAFTGAFETVIDKASKNISLGRVCQHDGPLEAKYFKQGFFEKIQALGPYGRGFQAPTFYAHGIIEHLMPLGKTQQHLKCYLLIEGQKQVALWFFAPSHIQHSFTAGQRIVFYFHFSLNHFRDKKQLQCIIEHAHIAS